MYDTKGQIPKMISNKNLLVFLLLTLVWLGCKQTTDFIKPSYRPLTEAVYSTVTVVPKEVYNVYPAVSGIITSSILTEGKIVKKGELLFSIDQIQSTLNKENARLNYDLAKYNFEGNSAILKDLKENIQTASLKFQNDSINYQRFAILWEKGIGTKQEFDNQKLLFETSRNELSKMINTYKRTEKDLANKLKIANNTYQISTNNNEEYRVTSLMNGAVYEVLKKVGEAVNPQTPVALIGSENDFILKLLIDEVDISRLQIGQLIIVSLDAFENETFECELKKIYPSKDLRSQTFTIEAAFKTQPKILMNGLSGEANIIVSKKDHVLTLPSQYINEKNQVNTKKGLVQVEVGISSLQFTEILNGIDTTTEIYKLETSE